MTVELQSIPIEKLLRVLIDKTVERVKSVGFPVEVVGFPLAESDQFYTNVRVVFDEAVPEDDVAMPNEDLSVLIGSCSKFCDAIAELGIDVAMAIPNRNDGENLRLGSIRIMFNVDDDNIDGTADSVN